MNLQVFETPHNTALRIERPDARIADCVSDYYVLDSDGPEVMGAVEWSMPGSANIRLFMNERPINVTIGNRVFAPTPHIALYGPSGRASRVESFGGITVGIGVTALGWARLFDEPAERFRDRIVPLVDAMPARVVNALYDKVRASDCGHDVKPVLDTLLVDLLATPHPDEPIIRRLMQMIVDETVADITAIADTLDMKPQRLRNVSLRYFGFPPKRLLRRARFLRSLLRMYAAGEADYGLIARSYFDVSHFLRDSEEFLGTTPRRFMAMQTPYMRQIFRARAAVLGVPVQALHSPGDAV
ncbi:hypothetical protein ACG3SL_12305 [Sphingomonas sp. CJ20]